MAAIFSIASGKGGVGKTLITTSFGILLSRQGKKVIMIDGDMGLRNMDLGLGVENECLYNIYDAAQGKCFLEEAIIPVSKNLDFLPASQNDSWDTVFPSAFDTVLEDIQNSYDFILIDCPAGLGKGIETAFSLSDHVVLVIAPSWASRRSADRLRTMVKPQISAHFVLNQFSYVNDRQIGFDDMLETVDPDLFGGVLPYSEAVNQLSHFGHMTELDNDCTFSKALAYILRSILEDKEFPVTRWQSLICQGDKENEKILNGLPFRKSHYGLTWNSGSKVYRRRRR